MTPLAENGAVHSFDISTSSWTTLVTSSSSFPCARSYHCATGSSKQLIIHAGCGDASTGRLKDTWAFDPSTLAWTQLADGPGDARGGSAISYLNGRIWRFGGFNGKTEIGGTVDSLRYDPVASQSAQEEWTSVSFGPTAGEGRENTGSARNASRSGPEPRSVAGLLALGNDLLAFFGEGKPSATGGHDTAGGFWGDAWIFRTQSGRWDEMSLIGDAVGERGWFGSDVMDANRVVIWGGTSSDNQRLGDGYILELLA
jgi:hypothetical protein